MRGVIASILLSAVLMAGAAQAAYLGLGEEANREKRKGGVVFPVMNKTNRNINQIFGWVYGYEEKQPYAFKLAANPHAPARRVTAGPHLPGQTALYWFPVPAYHLKMKKFGVVVYDASVSFDN
ncbi:MAG: hypothetical protein HZA04_07055 [Nitrospinae bacterium]|nr:hypothetical protein [Nitrospinota bacterium]